MKLLIQNNRIVGTATADYVGPMQSMDAPAEFDLARMAEYVIENGAAIIPPPPIPTAVTMRQARLALLQANLLTQVNNAIAAMPGPAGEAVRIEWEYAQGLDRNHALVQALIPALGLTEAQVDALFTEAAKL